VLTARSVHSHPPQKNNDGEAQYQAEILKLNTKNFFLSFFFSNFEKSLEIYDSVLRALWHAFIGTGSFRFIFS
jgi:hypothetical protein